MKIIAKTKAILIQNTAETMVEVIVAFVVLSIVMVLFAQGMRYAATAEDYAMRNTRKYDEAMIRLQNTVTGKNPGDAHSTEIVNDSISRSLSGDPDADPIVLKVNKYEVSFSTSGDSNTCIYYVFDAK